MRIISIDIAGYGKFRDFHLELDEGLNSFCNENGWGKTTLCSFIKVMLYGFDNEGKTSFLSERKKYLPFDGGNYGGSLTIEVKNESGIRRYEIKKEFTEKKNDCKFSLFDADTGLVSYDYSENIGEEILGIDMESFERSVFISQSDIGYKITDNISSLVGKIVDNTDDLNSYEKVEELIKGVVNSNSPSKKTGYLYKKKLYLDDLKNQIANKAIVENKIENALIDIDSKRDKLKLISEEEAKLTRKKRDISEYRERLSLKRLAEAIVKNYKEKKNAFEREKTFFPLKVPAITEVLDYIKLSDEVISLEIKRDNIENYLSMEMSKEDKAEEERYFELADIFENNEYDDHVTASCINAWQKLQESKRVLSVYEEKLDELYEKRKNEFDGKIKRINLRSISFLLLMIIMIILAAFFYFSAELGINIFPNFDYKYISIAATGLLALLFFALYFVNNGIKKRILALKENNYGDAKLDELSAKIIENESFIDNTILDVSYYIEGFGIDFNEDQVLNDLFDIKAMAAEYTRLKRKYTDGINRINQKKSEVENLNIKINSINGQINSFLDELMIKREDDIIAQFYNMKTRVLNHDQLVNEYEFAEKEILNFKNEHHINDIDEIASFDVNLEFENEDVNDIQIRLDQLTVLEKDIKVEISEIERELDSYRQDINYITDLTEKLEAEKINYQEECERYALVQKARDYLQKAKINLTNKFTNPVKEKFDLYYESFVNILDNKFALNANLELSLDITTKKVPINHLSAGYQDIVNICMRLALIDEMYDSESPFLVIDDSFEKLDDDKLVAVREFIKNYASKRQVLYFTCSQTRLVSN